MSSSTLATSTVVLAAVVLAPFLADHLRRWVAIPSVVLELVLGVLIGPVVLGIAHETAVVSTMADFGLSFLMFLAGYEIQFERIRGTPLRGALLGWLCSLVIGFALALPFHGITQRSAVVVLAATTTALGTILPMVRDAGLLATPFGGRILAVGAIGEFGPIVAVALVFANGKPGRSILAIVGFALIGAVAAWLARLPRTERMRRMVSATLGTSVQLAVRVVMLVVVAMLWITSSLGLDVLLGAFAAGIVIRLFFRTVEPAETEVIEAKMDSIGYGFFIPFFFVVSGMRLDLAALFRDPPVIALIPAFLVLFLLTRGVPTYLLNGGDRARRGALSLLAATGLPMVVAITSSGVDAGLMSTSVAAAMVTAGVLSVLAYPLVALRLLARSGAEEPAADG